MLNKKISIIVPVYNKEKYLKYCINSVLNQTYRNFELILVDDDSSDNSLIICEQFSKIDNRVKTFHIKNKGVSNARNFGVKKSSGKLIMFLDADDWIKNTCLELMINLQDKKNYDLVCGSIGLVYPHSDKGTLSVLDKEYTTKNKNELLDFVYSIEQSSCAKLFKREKIINNSIKFPLGIKNGEDSIFLNNYLCLCKTIRCTPEIVYYYNKLEINSTGSQKYYSEINKWRYKEYLCQANLFKKIMPANAKTEIYCSEVATKRFLEAISDYTESVRNQEKYVEILIETYLMFIKYIDNNMLKRTLECDKIELTKKKMDLALINICKHKYSIKTRDILVSYIKYPIWKIMSMYRKKKLGII